MEFSEWLDKSDKLQDTLKCSFRQRESNLI